MLATKSVLHQAREACALNLRAAMVQTHEETTQMKIILALAICACLKAQEANLTLEWGRLPGTAVMMNRTTLVICRT